MGCRILYPRRIYFFCEPRYINICHCLTAHNFAGRNNGSIESGKTKENGDHIDDKVADFLAVSLHRIIEILFLCPTVKDWT